MRIATIIILSASLTPASLLARAAPSSEKKPPWVDIAQTTYSQRTKDSKFNQKSENEWLVLPNVSPGPAPFTPYVSSEPPGYIASMTDRSKVIWRMQPLSDLHAQYLKTRSSFISQGKRSKLVDWCEKNRLYSCAEFELRHELVNYSQVFTKPHYQAVLKRWWRHSDRQPLPKYSFPLPVKGEWFVSIDTAKHHRHKAWAAHALDFVIKKNGSLAKTTSRRADDHYAWGQPILAQADGMVVHVIDNIPDNKIGEMLGKRCNLVTIDYGDGIVGDYAHNMKGSAKVKIGDEVKAGQVIALVGNSGASGLPHLHYSLCDYSDFSIKGRYHYEQRVGATWVTRPGVPLAEGIYVRNVATAATETATAPTKARVTTASRARISDILNRALKLRGAERTALLSAELKPDKETLSILSSFYKRGTERSRLLIIETLGVIEAKDTIPFLSKTALTAPSRPLRLASARAIGQINDHAVPDAIYQTFEHSKPSSWLIAVEALGEIGDPKSAKVLEGLLKAVRPTKATSGLGDSSRRSAPVVRRTQGGGRQVSFGRSATPAKKPRRPSLYQPLIDAIEAALEKL
jgi:hypothetical protein